MKKSNVYTRTGDQGLTSLVGGTRVPKNCTRLEAYGTIEELNSQLGLLLTYVTDATDRQRLIQCQCDLFSIGSMLATEPDSKRTPIKVITPEDVEDLEHAIDQAADGLPGWRGFTLPGGSRGAAVAHVCRTVCRRAERRIYALCQEAPVDSLVTAYVNRLSDYLYVLACRINHLEGREEILWAKRTPAK